MHLVVHARIVNHFIFLQRSSVSTPLSIKSHLSLSRHIGPFGSDDNYTISTTSTVKSIGSRILQYCHWLNVVRIDIINITAIRSAVHNNQRVILCIDWAKTTNLDGWLWTRSTVIGSQCHTRHSTCQGISNIRHLRLLQLFGTNHLSRTRKCRLLCCTESNHHYLIKHLSIRLHHHFYAGFYCHLLGLHTNIRNYQSFRGTWYVW